MVREHLGVVVSTAQRLDPFRDPPMLRRAISARNLSVRDVPNEDVEERILRLVRDRRSACPLHESLPL